MRLWIALYLPQLSLEVFHPNWCADSLAVVVQQRRVIAASHAAITVGVRRGMRAGGIPVLLPQALLHERAPAREAQALQAAAMALLQYTPQVSLEQEDSILLDIGASLSLFGGIRALCRQIRHTLRQLGLTAVLACAPTAAGAALLARGCKPHRAGLRCLKSSSLQYRLDRLPCAIIPAIHSCLDWLTDIGCHHLAALRQLPRDGLLRRDSQAMHEVLQLLDCAYGSAIELRHWITTPPHFRQRLELSERIEHADAIMASAQALLSQLSGWLTARQLAVTHVRLQLEHERGRQAIAPTNMDLQLAAPSAEESHLLRLLKERLARLELHAPIIALSLEALQTQALPAISQTLFPQAGGTPLEQKRLLELLMARLGQENILQPAPLADYRPELANRWLPLSGSDTTIRTTSTQLPVAATSDLPPRPAWLLPQPKALSMQGHRPCYGSPLRLLSPPERIEAGWWNGQLITRDYYVAVATNHCLYWIYRERIGDVDGRAPLWYLHGLFG